MTDVDSTKPLYEASVKLCAAVRKHKCLHDQNSYTKNAGPKCEDAWQMVAEECSESIEFCKSRWKSLRRCFFEGLKRKGNKYYLHDHLEFLLETGNKKSKRSSVPIYNDETNSNLSDSLQKPGDNSLKLKERAPRINKIFDDDDIKSYGSQTTSADESNEIVSQAGGVFIINELEDDPSYQPDKELEEDRRLSFSRSCKRALDPNLIDELADEEIQPKRPRKTDKSNAKPYTVRVDKMKITAQKIEPVKSKAIDIIASTESKLSVDVGIQCGMSCTDFDDLFMQSIKNQLQEMNGRQKMNFKRKIYQSLLEVFDDANDFPNNNEILSCANKQPISVVNTTVGELRLMRELVSLVQAAKGTPEIVNAKEKIKATTPAASKPPIKMPAPILENRAKNTKSPLSISPTPEDDDLQFFIDDSDEEEEIPLPRTWDEIKAKTAETSKTAIQENSIGVPRRVLQKVVRVAGSNGGTILARDGDKKRIYRIVPKIVYPNGTSATGNKNDSSVGRIIVSSTKPQDHRKDSSVGTFYVANAKNAQDTSKINSSTPNFSIRPFNSKSATSSQPAATSPNSNQPTSSNTNYNNINGQSIFKNIHPANRILSSSTGYFKMVPSNKPITPPLNQKPSSQPTATATNTSVSKVMTAKFPVSPMLPPSSNITTKRIQAVRATPPILQRRFSICGSLPTDKQNTATSINTAKNVVSSNTSTAQVQPNQIQISKPVSLNTKAVTSPTASSTQTNSSVNNAKTPASAHAAKSTDPQTPKDSKLSIKPIEASKESSSVPPKNPMLETTVIQREIPILETAGTVEADDLDPLFVKAPQVKSEPVDDD